MPSGWAGVRCLGVPGGSLAAKSTSEAMDSKAEGSGPGVLRVEGSCWAADLAALAQGPDPSPPSLR